MGVKRQIVKEGCLVTCKLFMIEREGGLFYAHMCMVTVKRCLEMSKDHYILIVDYKEEISKQVVLSK